ncbi:MAG: histone deacetylase, partial [Planctomycetota bacterium]
VITSMRRLLRLGDPIGPTNQQVETMLLYQDSCFELHNTGSHPEQIARITRVNEALNTAGWTDRCTTPLWQPASIDALTTAHQSSYVAQLRQWCEQDAGRIESDTMVCNGTWKAATMGAGAAIDAVAKVADGQAQRAFAAIRPPGHHALPSGAMGFCVLNNVAIAAHQAIAKGLHRVLIVDWDVHHGNGTQDAFYEDGRVGFFSIHRSPFYPGTGSESETGSGAGLGWIMNRPVTGGILRQQFFDGFQMGLDRIAAKVKPELILLSAGFDAHRNDPIGSLCLDSEDFGKLTEIVVEVAKSYCEGKIVSLLEGGYHLDHLPESVLAHLRTLNDKVES